LGQAFLKKWWVESDFKAPNLPLSLRFKVPAGNPVSFEILQDGRLIALNHTTGIYSTICSQNWDDVDAGVVCRNLRKTVKTVMTLTWDRHF
jgi:hypothetical protein